MKITAMVTMAAVAAASAWASEAERPAKRTVTVCVDPGPDVQAVRVAQVTASKIFVEAGVRIDWRSRRSCPAGGEAIVVSLSNHTPGNKLRGAYAYALPYEGTHIVVFYDHVQKRVGPERAPFLLGYVLAHEITHILQCVSRHAPDGIMKAEFGPADFFEMWRGKLSFTPEDIQLIRWGMDARESRAHANIVRSTVIR